MLGGREMTRVCDAARELAFTIVVTGVSRVLLARDRLFGRLSSRDRARALDHPVAHLKIPSGSQVLDAVFVKPAASPALAAVLICHGIGETVEHWAAVQQLLADTAVASLVFDYAGYGRSSGFVHAAQCELDAMSAFRCLQRLTPSLPISVLGFSLGTGIAAALLQKVPMCRLLLCASFTSLKAAMFSAGVPPSLAVLMLDTWQTEEALLACEVPVLILHGQEDRLFPVQMAVDLKNACRSQAELVIVPGLSHDDPDYRPQPSYWSQTVASFLLGG